jgi:ribosomal protein S6
MARNQDENEIMTEVDDMGSDPRVYELGFHLDPELPTEEVKKAYQTVHSLIASKGTVIAEVEPEKIQLAYTISRQEVSGRRDFNSAYFSWIVYETTPDNHAEVISAAGADKSIIRFVDIVTSKDAARHALEVHELREKAPVAETDPEEVLATEVDAALESATI